MNLTELQAYKTGFLSIVNNLLVPVLVTLAFGVFVWGVVNYFFINAGSDTKREEGKQLMLWGIIGFVIIFSVWGLVAIVGETLGLQPGGTAPAAPTFGSASQQTQSVPVPLTSPTQQSVPTPLTPPTPCTGSSFGVPGVCTAVSACPGANTDTSPDCAQNQVCCASNPISTGSGNTQTQTTGSGSTQTQTTGNGSSQLGG